MKEKKRYYAKYRYKNMDRMTRQRHYYKQAPEEHPGCASNPQCPYASHGFICSGSSGCMLQIMKDKTPSKTVSEEEA